MTSGTVGGSGVFEVVFRDASQAIADPDDVYFLWTEPDGTTGMWHYGVDPQVVRLSLGRYAAALPWTSSGNWTGGFQGVSADPLGVNAIDDATVCVGSSLLVPV